MKIAPSHESQSSNDENEFIHVTPEERKKPFIRYLPFSFEALARFKFLILIFDQTVHLLPLLQGSSDISDISP